MESKLNQLSQDYMKAVNQTPAPAELAATMGEPEQIPMAAESFVHSLGISLRRGEEPITWTSQAAQSGPG